MNYTPEEIQEALRVISAAVLNCQKQQVRFKSGTPQHSLLRNRVKALKIAAALLRADGTAARYTAADLEQAVEPLSSIIRKTAAAQAKYSPDTPQYKRFQPTITAMEIGRAAVEHAQEK